MATVPTTASPDDLRLIMGKAGRAARRKVRQVQRKVRGLGVPHRIKSKPGAKPGIDAHELTTLQPIHQDVTITCVEYGIDKAETRTITDLDAFLKEPMPAWARVRWINVDGLGNMHAIQALAQHYRLHPLAIEDVVHVHQRPKMESYNGPDSERPRLFVVARMLQVIDGHSDSEQISIFLGRHTVLTFQQRSGDVFGPVRDRINRQDSRLRQNDAGFLLYALLDALVDHYFPALEHYSTALEQLEERVFAGDRNVIHDVHAIKHELMLLRREIWPMRDLVNVLQRETQDILSDTARLYLRDVYDHTVQVIELAETYREVANGLAETWQGAVSVRVNEAMKVLTVIATIFIPLSFFVGIYGMNFHYMPEIEWPGAYPWVYPIGFWAICFTVVFGLLGWFRYRRWL